MVETYLSILGRVNCISLSKLGLSKLSKTVHLPPYERIVIRIDASRSEGSLPINSEAKLCEVLLAYVEKDINPVTRVGEAMDSLQSKT